MSRQEANRVSDYRLLDRQGRNKFGKELNAQKDIYGADWLLENWPKDLLSKVVDKSKKTSLRRICGEKLYSEGYTLLQRFDQQFAPIGGLPDAGNAVKGFLLAARHILIAGDYINDKESLTRKIFQRSKENKVNISVLDILMNEGIESFTIDPTGVDWLKRNLTRLTLNENAFNLKDRGPSYGGDTPLMLGYRHAIERYSELYHQAIAAGARADKSEGGILGKTLLKTKRMGRSYVRVLKDIIKR